MSKKISLVAACCRSHGIGINGNLPWRLKSEMDFFSRITSTVLDTCNGVSSETEPIKKNAVIMGTKTYMSIPPKFRPLKDRVNVVLSRTITEAPAGASYLFRSLDEAVSSLSALPNVDQLFIIGGSEIYSEAIKRPDCEFVFLTRIDADFECDRFFPIVDMNQYEDITDMEQYKHIVEERFQIPKGIQTENGIEFRYHLYKRK